MFKNLRFLKSLLPQSDSGKILLLTSTIVGGKLEEGERKKRQTQVCCLNILLTLSVKNGDVMRKNSLGLI